jgi:hypothetical protein
MAFLSRFTHGSQQRIWDQVDSIDQDMLARVWQELDYRVDICPVTAGGHVEHL